MPRKQAIVNHHNLIKSSLLNDLGFDIQLLLLLLDASQEGIMNDLSKVCKRVLRLLWIEIMNVLDTVLNTIELKCTDGTKLTSKGGWWGKWEPWKEIDDPDENRIVGVWMKGEAPCGCCDDTAANGVRFVDLYDKTYRPGDYIFLS